MSAILTDKNQQQVASAKPKQLQLQLPGQALQQQLLQQQPQQLSLQALHQKQALQQFAQPHALSKTGALPKALGMQPKALGKGKLEPPAPLLEALSTPLKMPDLPIPGTTYM